MIPNNKFQIKNEPMARGVYVGEIVRLRGHWALIDVPFHRSIVAAQFDTAPKDLEKYMYGWHATSAEDFDRLQNMRADRRKFRRHHRKLYKITGDKFHLKLSRKS